MTKAPQKWRPSLALVISAILVSVLLLPLIGISFLRVYENHLIRQTEAELIAQSAVYSALLARKIQQNPQQFQLGKPVAPENLPNEDAPLHPVYPQLQISKVKILPPRPDAVAVEAKLARGYENLSELFSDIVHEAGRSTLAGIRIIDPNGLVIAGGRDAGLSFAHVDEVASALSGSYKSAVRQRISDKPPPPLSSISRDGKIRVFVALPVIVGQKVAGVIYAARVPKSVAKAIYQQRYRLFAVALFVLAATVLMAWVLTRTITRPILDLMRRTRQIGSGAKNAIRPLRHHGTREMAELSDSFLAMSGKLVERSEYISTFAAHVSHELKSPLTSIRGAAELMLDETMEMSEDKRQQFLGNIVDDSEQLTRLVGRLRSLAHAENPPLCGSVALKTIVKELQIRFPDTEFVVLETDAELVIAMTPDNAGIVFSNLIENAVSNGASRVAIEIERLENTLQILVSDNGQGISPGNADKIFQLFFTTNRDAGGTGMGLSITRSIVTAHKGSIRLKQQASGGAVFEITLPA